MFFLDPSPETEMVFFQREKPSIPYTLIAQKPPPITIKPKPKEDAYASLYCDDRDKKCISEIIRHLGERGKMWLLGHKSYMNELGDSIQHVHPLKFLEVICSDDYLKACMREAFEDYFKRNHFMDGLGEGLNNKAMTGDLEQHIPDFAEAVHITKEEIFPYFQKRDWEGLVRYLITH